MQVNPAIAFYIGLVTCIAMVLATTSLWAGWLPDAWVPIVVGVNNVIGKVGTAVMTFLAGVSSRQQGPIAKLWH